MSIWGRSSSSNPADRPPGRAPVVRPPARAQGRFFACGRGLAVSGRLPGGTSPPGPPTCSSRDVPLAVDLSSILIITTLLVLMLLDRHQQAGRPLRERAPGPPVAEENRAFQAESTKAQGRARAPRANPPPGRGEGRPADLHRFSGDHHHPRERATALPATKGGSLVGRSFMELIPGGRPRADARPPRILLHARAPRAASVEHLGRAGHGRDTVAAMDGPRPLRRAGAPGRVPVRRPRITGRKQAEEAPREKAREERLRAPSSPASADRHLADECAAGDVLSQLSPSWEALTGQTPERDAQVRLARRVRPDDRARPMAVWTAAAADKRLLSERSCASARAYLAATGTSTRGRAHPAAERQHPRVDRAPTPTSPRASECVMAALPRGASSATSAAAAAGDGRSRTIDLDRGDDVHRAPSSGAPSSELRRTTRSGIVSTAWIAGGPTRRRRAREGGCAAAYAAGGRPTTRTETSSDGPTKRTAPSAGSWPAERPVGGPEKRRRVVGTDTDVTARKQWPRSTLREVGGFAIRAMLLRGPRPDRPCSTRSGVYLELSTPRSPPSSLVPAFPLPRPQRARRSSPPTWPPGSPGASRRTTMESGESPDPDVRRHHRRASIRHWEARVVPCGTDKVLKHRSATSPSGRRRRTRRASCARSWPAWARSRPLGALTGSAAGPRINQPWPPSWPTPEAATGWMIAARQPTCVELRDTLSDIVSDASPRRRRAPASRALLAKEAPGGQDAPRTSKSTMEEILQLVHSDVVMRRVASRWTSRPTSLRAWAIASSSSRWPRTPDQRLRGRPGSRRRAARRVRLQTSRQDGRHRHQRGGPGPRSPRRRPGPRVRAVLHDQAGRHGAGPAHLPDHRPVSRRRLVAAANADTGMTFSLRLPVALPRTSPPRPRGGDRQRRGAERGSRGRRIASAWSARRRGGLSPITGRPGGTAPNAISRSLLPKA